LPEPFVGKLTTNQSVGEVVAQLTVLMKIFNDRSCWLMSDLD
jgi:hypothetical protein